MILVWGRCTKVFCSTFPKIKVHDVTCIGSSTPNDTLRWRTRAACNNLEMAMTDGDTTQGVQKAFRKSHPAINAMNLSHAFGDHFFLPISYQLYFARNCLFVFPLNRGKIHFYKSQNADFCQSIHSALEAWKEESKSKIYVSTKLFLWFNAAGNHKLLNLLGMPQSTLQSTSLYMVTKTM